MGKKTQEADVIFPLTATLPTLQTTRQAIVRSIESYLDGYQKIKIAGIGSQRMVGYVWGIDPDENILYATLYSGKYIALYQLLDSVALSLMAMIMLPPDVTAEDVNSGDYQMKYDDIKISHFQWLSSKERWEMETWNEDT